MRNTKPIILSTEERTILSQWTHEKNLLIRLVQRARIVQMAAAGVQNQEIARRLKVSRPTVQLWRQRFLALRLRGLEKDAPRPGRTPRIDPKKIRAVVEATLHTKPSEARNWSTRSMAEAQALSQATIRRIWKHHGLAPHLESTSNVGLDKRIVEKLHDVVGLYLNPPDMALVSYMGEESHTPEAHWARTGLTMKKVRSGAMTYHDKRHCTTQLFAALSLLDGKVFGDGMPRHQHQEFIRFLKQIHTEVPAGLDLHLIISKHGIHKHKRVQSWLGRHSQFRLHITPDSSSWLKLIERWLRELRQTPLCRGSFESLPALISGIKTYIEYDNQNPQIFAWTACMDQNLAEAT